MSASANKKKTPNSPTCRWMKLSSPLGWLRIETCRPPKSKKWALSRLLFTLPGSDEAPTLDTCADEPETELEQELARILRHYFQGKPVDFSSVPIVWIHGTEFQQQAWETLRTIPAGETWNYGEQATAMDRKKAVRAVGQANRNNPIPIIVPCHRVVAASGKLQGYGGQSYGSTGLHIKGFLIQLEQAALGQAELPTFYPSWVEAASNKM